MTPAPRFTRFEEFSRPPRRIAPSSPASTACLSWRTDVLKRTGKVVTKRTPARRMIAQAGQLGLLVMVGCMTESTVGISAIAQLLPLLDYVDMDGAVLLAAAEILKFTDKDLRGPADSNLR